jgi:hypothetical protein
VVAMVAGIDNLKVPTSEEARKYGRLGGIASGKARREKATMKKTLEMLLDTVPKCEANPEGKTFRELTTEGLMIGATQGKAENYKLMLQLLGEMQEDTVKETPSVEIKVIDNSNLEKVLYEEKDI